jgi:hypothetical protein
VGEIDQRIILIAGFFANSLLGLGQFNLGYEESFFLDFDQGGSLRMATVGGFNNPQFSEIDLDGDSYLDLFVFDRNMDTWRTFLYNPSSLRYDYKPEYESQFPTSLAELVLLRDFNCDSAPDIFTYYVGGFKVFRNDGAFPPSFSLEVEKIQTDYGTLKTSLYLLPGDVPAITDVDNDGDLDILTFGNGDSENTIVWHQNRSMDEYGNCDSLKFEVVTHCWGGVEEPPNQSQLEAIACRPVSPPSGDGTHAARHHPGSSVLLIDSDGDNDKDLILGDIQTDRLVYAPNIGDEISAEIDVTQQTTAFPNTADPAAMQYMISGYEIDANKDGKMDLVLVPNNNIDSTCNTNQIWYYRNNASSGTDYSLVTKAFLSEDMLDLGTGVVPVYFDVDGDQLKDLLLAVDFFRSPTNSTNSRIHFYKNTGSATQPLFKLQNEDYTQISKFNFQAASPALGDLDGDGDQDMIIGTANGRLHYFRNDGTGGVANFVLIEANYQGINSIGLNAAPELADLTGDGLLDLIVGERSGRIRFFENIGTTTSAEFDANPSIGTLGGIDVSYFCCLGNAAPRIIKNAAFGTGTYLFVGSSEKQIKIYAIPTNLADTFDLVDSIHILADRITPIFDDFNNDEIYDLLIGTGEGGVKYFQRNANYPVGTEPLVNPNTQMIFNVFPNPTNDQIQISFEESVSGKVEIFDLRGQKLLERPMINSRVMELNLNNLVSETYIVTFTNADFRWVKKVIVSN